MYNIHNIEGNNTDPCLDNLDEPEQESNQISEDEFRCPKCKKITPIENWRWSNVFAQMVCADCFETINLKENEQINLNDSLY